MGKRNDTTGHDQDAADEILSDPDLDPAEFVEVMEERRPVRGSLKRVDDLNDEKWLRAQLADWDDWD